MTVVYIPVLARDAQETMDTDPVLSEDIPESSIEPEVDDSLDADEWRRYL